LNVEPSSTPHLVVRPEKTYKNKPSSRCYAVKRQRIDVLMDFLSPDGCTEIMGRLKDGYEVLSPTQVRPYVYGIDMLISLNSNMRIPQRSGANKKFMCLLC
jgi:hypothetical protein